MIVSPRVTRSTAPVTGTAYCTAPPTGSHAGAGTR